MRDGPDNMLTKNKKRQIILEEIANGITHGVGFLLSVAATTFLVFAAAREGHPRKLWTLSVYGASLIFLYGASTLYHILPAGRKKHILRIIDHSAIYILIAGTYTPFTLIGMEGFLGRGLFRVIWSLALAGIVFKIFFVGKFFALSAVLYLLMGWLAVVGIRPMSENIPAQGIALLLAGGLFYTFGVVFHCFKRLSYAHAIWHVFVLAGSACHYFAVLLYLLPLE